MHSRLLPAAIVLAAVAIGTARSSRDRAHMIDRYAAQLTQETRQ
jgi:hypothetical protein